MKKKSNVSTNDHLVAINKPAGLPMKAEKTSHIDARLIDNFSLYQVIEDLRHHFNSPDMNLALPLPRNHSGIVVFGKNQVITKSIADKFYLAYGNKQLHQQFHLLCIGNPENLLEEIKQIFLKKKEIQGKLESIEVNKLSVNERKKGQGVMCTYKIKTLSKRLKCGYVELMTNTYTEVDEVKALDDAVTQKQKTLIDLNNRLLEQTSEENLEQEITDSDEYMYELDCKIRQIRKFIKSFEHVETHTIISHDTVGPSTSRLNPDAYHFTPEARVDMNRCAIDSMNQQYSINAPAVSTIRRSALK
ncbi:unnamed protein product [Mytilus edulis]|uniref:Uncharacterized protein n=1 Tax=Mytilus edulis TaxID=6550 RepID=A0A8S3QW07_MYTED|nr:unnamed protein product [Mytilus edulis]